MKKIIQVHIADDHKIIIEGIVAVLNTEEDISVLDYSLTGEQVLEWFRHNTADVLVLDINMPVISGIDVLRKLVKEDNPPKIIVLSSYDDVRFIQKIITIGANGFLSKNSAGEQLVKAIRAVNDGERYFSEDVKKELFKITFGQKVKEGDKPPSEDETLTTREVEVVRLIALEYNSLEIADLLNITINTVKTYRKNILKKLNEKSTVGLIKFAIKHKIV